MSWLDFFKKEETKIILTIDELISKLKSEEDKLELKNKKIKEEIKQNLSLLIYDLSSQIQVLKSINLEQRREAERIKKIVLENLSFYTIHLEKLIKGLEIIDQSPKTEEYIKEIQDLFGKFKKDSHNNFEKSTILIGKELEVVQKIIKKYFENFNQIIDKNKDLFEKLILIKNLQNQISEFHNIKRIQEEIKSSIGESKKIKNNLLIEKDLLEKQYKTFLESKEYRLLFKDKEKTEKDITNLNLEVFKIKEKINLKFLLKYYHGDHKNSKLLLDYKDNFLSMLEEDKNLEIIKIVKEVLNLEIAEEIGKIKEETLRLKQQPKAGIPEKMNSFVNKINNLDLDILNMHNQIEEENKKILRFNTKQGRQLNEIKQWTKSILGEVEVKE
ncbi:MAG: hypothetical protein AABX29_00320 [Nanoarchaeota archaeon]